MITMMFTFSFFVVLMSLSFSSKDALSVLMLLEILILSLLHYLSLFYSENSTLFFFSISFFLMALAVLAASMALSMLSGFKKINSNLMNSNMF